jgi:hypothetical protein
VKQRLGFAIGERADHSFDSYTHAVQIAKRSYQGPAIARPDAWPARKAAATRECEGE